MFDVLNFLFSRTLTLNYLTGYNIPDTHITRINTEL